MMRAQLSRAISIARGWNAEDIAAPLGMIVVVVLTLVLISAAAS